MELKQREVIKNENSIKKFLLEFRRIGQRSRKGLQKVLPSFGVPQGWSEGDYEAIKRREGAAQHALVVFPVDYHVALQLETAEGKTEEGINSLDFAEVTRRSADLHSAPPAITSVTWCACKLQDSIQNITASPMILSGIDDD